METTKSQVYEPKTNNRFLVEFPEQYNIPSWVIQKINKPKFTNGEWENIRVEFIDLIKPSTSQSLFKIISFLKTNKNDNSTLFEINIKMLDSIGVEVEKWTIYVEKVLTINFGDLNYGDNQIQELYLIIKPLDCVLNC